MLGCVFLAWRFLQAPVGNPFASSSHRRTLHCNPREEESSSHHGRAHRVEEIERAESRRGPGAHDTQTVNDTLDRFVELEGEGVEPLARGADRANQGGRNRGGPLGFRVGISGPVPLKPKRSSVEGMPARKMEDGQSEPLLSFAFSSPLVAFTLLFFYCHSHSQSHFPFPCLWSLLILFCQRGNEKPSRWTLVRVAATPKAPIPVSTASASHTFFLLSLFNLPFSLPFPSFPSQPPSSDPFIRLPCFFLPVLSTVKSGTC